MAQPYVATSLADFLRSVNESLGAYDSLTASNSEEIFQYLRDLLRRYCIKFSHETVAALERINGLRNRHGIYLPARLRIVLKAERTRADFRHELVRVCNGMVIVIEEVPPPALAVRTMPVSSEPTPKVEPTPQLASPSEDSAAPIAEPTPAPKLHCRVLALPVREFNPNEPKTHNIGGHLRRGEYDIYPIVDGTILNLYYDDGHVYETENLGSASVLVRGKWYYGSRNAFCVEDNIWRGYTYREVLAQLLALLPMRFDTLSRELTYTLGIYHPAFHPFNQPAVWLNNSRLDDPKTAWRYSFWIIHASYRDGSPCQPSSLNIGLKQHAALPPDDDPLALECIRRYNEVSCEVLLGDPPRKGPRRTAADLPPDLTKFHYNGNPVFLGYILRLKEPARSTEPNSPIQDVILESTLWRSIRHMLYEAPDVNIRDRRSKTARFRDIHYVVLHNVLNRDLINFHRLFPQYVSMYQDMWRRVDCVMDAIYEQLAQVRLGPEHLVCRPEEYLGGSYTGKDPLRDKQSWAHQYAEWRREYSVGLIPNLVVVFRGHIEYQVVVSPKLPSEITVGRQTVGDMMTHKKYLDVFYEHFYLAKPRA
jgi:hypothetical protein